MILRWPGKSTRSRLHKQETERINLTNIIDLLDKPDTTIAVVGATDNIHKFGAVIYRDLKRKGYAVFAVNPGRNTVDGDPAWASVAELPSPPTIINFVTPPEVTLEVLKDCKRQNLMNVWVQPGAEDPMVMDYLQTNGFNYLAAACIMVESRMKA